MNNQIHNVYHVFINLITIHMETLNSISYHLFLFYLLKTKQEISNKSNEQRTL